MCELCNKIQLFCHIAANFHAATMATMPRALIIQHITHEGPGRLAPLLIRRGYQIDLCLAYAGGIIPSTLNHDLLVIMGGPMGVVDCGGSEYPFLAQEVRLLQSVLQHNQPTIGICLGAQLLAHAAGARVYPNQSNGKAILEVGWATVDFHGVNNRPELHGIQAQETMLHWHGDTFDLPKDATLLASTPRCRHQLFRLKRQVGFQFHPEVDEQMIQEWTRSDAAYVEKANGPQGSAQIRNDTLRHMAHHHLVGDQLLGNVVDEITLGSKN
jgi:GMP synthase (glutamine-hydrolysing)